MDQSDAQLFMASARSVEQRLGNFIAQSLANTAWAFATVDQLDAQLFTVSARSVEHCLGDFLVQDLANTALAMMDIQRPKLMQKIGAVAFLIIGQSSFEQLLQLLHFFQGYQEAGDELWATAVSSQHVCKHAFLCMSLKVALCMQGSVGCHEGKGQYMDEQDGQQAVQIGYALVRDVIRVGWVLAAAWRFGTCSLDHARQEWHAME